MTVVDLSHPVIDAQPCTFTVVDKAPAVLFQEGDSHGMFFVTSEIANLASNVCTHIDFPGHLHTLETARLRTVGEYAVDRFVGRVAILDVSDVMETITPFFDLDGHLSVNPRDSKRVLHFLHCLEELVIDEPTLHALLDQTEATLDSLRGIIFATGNTEHWQYKTFDSWQYIYFFNPYLSDKACQAIVDAGLSFVGIDAFQLEHPLINFRGDELPVVLNQDCRDYVAERLQSVSSHNNHIVLLGNDVLIYENLRIPADIRGTSGDFSGPPLNLRLQGLNDNAPVRPYYSRMLPLTTNGLERVQ